MRIAIIATYTHPTRLPVKEPSIQQTAVPELIASLCPEDADIDIYNEKEVDVPMDRHWDLVFFSYLHAYYEHTKVLSTLLRRRGTVTIAGGRHASYFAQDASVISMRSPLVSPKPMCRPSFGTSLANGSGASTTCLHQGRLQ